ncbi:histidine phosphatase family protein [Pontibacter anaerobius]|uniref:Phosphoglycerate mutase family protein n=1 Tax=Pontibacter anaerobius TaxID=2993940 RepID=A0ABT3RE45_9BACT|nr:histidine phosphatase family protein [Pontibacter anaerobius]MCX2739894.1 phosphoglycerate mutase family protein [Pontibacter anaerobius]
MNSSPNRIFLIRHAKPKVEREGFFDVEAARQYISDYDTAQVEEFVLQHEAIPYKQIKKVYCSTLVRSQLTARAIFGEKVELKIDHTFREFERRIFTLPLLRLPIKLWLLSARLLWFLGFNSRDIETFRQARTRARKAAELLDEDARQNNTTVLVAHGLLNNFIRRELTRLGWQASIKGGNNFLSVHIMEKAERKV